jgi:hypothetical protein
MRAEHTTDGAPIRKVREQARPVTSNPPAVQATPPPDPAAPAPDVAPEAKAQVELAGKVRNVVQTGVATLSAKYKLPPAEVARLLRAACEEFLDGASQEPKP